MTANLRDYDDILRDAMERRDGADTRATSPTAAHTASRLSTARMHQIIADAITTRPLLELPLPAWGFAPFPEDPHAPVFGSKFKLK